MSGSLYRQQIADAVVSTLLAAATSAGGSVYADRDWPLTEPQLPAILVKCPYDRKESLVRGLPQFTTVSGILIVVRVSAVDSATAATTMATLLYQIEQAIISAGSPVQQMVQQFPAIETEVRSSSSGNTPISEALLKLECEYYEEFGPLAALGTPVANFGMEVSQPSGAPTIYAGVNAQTGGVPSVQP
ncbi:hypothetical protein [Acidocella sp.]|uniref:hypothetical protein n=1 Tax=Acidocella sp. TaxID=50710 RepID=UPI00260981C3|nr:hypothetical protein [Acidocella sp.]